MFENQIFQILTFLQEKLTSAFISDIVSENQKKEKEPATRGSKHLLQ